MKIIYLHQYFKKPSMNGGVRSYEFAKRLVRDGHEVVIVTSDTENDFSSWKVENIDGIEVHWLSVKYSNSFGFFKRLVAFFKYVVLTTLHIIPMHCDRVVATSTPLTISIPAMFYKLYRNKPYIFEVRDVWPEVPIALGFLNNPILKYLALFLERISYKYSDSIITLSPDMKNSVLKRANGKAVTVIPNASDTDLFSLKSDFSIKTEYSNRLYEIRERHEKVVFYTGTLGMVNNLSYLIDLASYSKGDIAFVIVGSGKEKFELEQLSQENGTLNRVVYFFEAMPKNHLYIIHQLFDLSCSTVLPVEELFANSANKIFDAFASGTPILINHEGWLAELIRSSGCGLILNSTPSEEEYTKLHCFLYDELEYSNARDSSKNLGVTDYNREYLYQKFIKAIKGESYDKANL